MKVESKNVLRDSGKFSKKLSNAHLARFHRRTFRREGFTIFSELRKFNSSWEIPTAALNLIFLALFFADRIALPRSRASHDPSTNSRARTPYVLRAPIGISRDFSAHRRSSNEIAKEKAISRFSLNREAHGKSHMKMVYRGREYIRDRVTFSLFFFSFLFAAPRFAATGCFSIAPATVKVTRARCSLNKIDS